MVGVEAVLVPILLLEGELCHRHGGNGYLEARKTWNSMIVAVCACEHSQGTISSAKLSGSYGMILSQKSMSSFRQSSHSSLVR